MPRGKLHYEAYEEDGELIEHWLDSHGTEHTQISYLDNDEDEGCAACGNPAYPDCMSSCSMFDD